jgi:hypothetical protein
MRATPSDRANRAFRFILAATALWTLMGAIPGYVDPAASFHRFTGTPAQSPLVLELYRGAWGQTLLFAIGYAVASFDPRRHALTVVLGAVGKLLYAARILVGFSGSPPTSLALTAAIGDLVFVALLVGSLVATRALRDRERSPDEHERATTPCA